MGRVDPESKLAGLPLFPGHFILKDAPVRLDDLARGDIRCIPGNERAPNAQLLRFRKREREQFRAVPEPTLGRSDVVPDMPAHGTELLVEYVSYGHPSDNLIPSHEPEVRVGH